AVNAGKEVTVHEKSINKHGWKGFGYIVIDPETGAGAYLIEGSGNGAWLAGLIFGVLLGLEFSIFVASAALAAIGPSIVIALVSALAIVITTAIAAVVLHSYQLDKKAGECFLGGLAFGLNSAALKVPAIIMLLLNIFIETSIETRGWQACSRE
ncbi:hypothetical protein, partial [Ottowia cancrivicina]